MSICRSVYCLRLCQSAPPPSPLLSIAISCVRVLVAGVYGVFILTFTNISLHTHKCTCIHAHTPAPSLRQVTMVGGKILPGEPSLPQAQLYNRLRCVYACACVCAVCLCKAWLPLLFQMSLFATSLSTASCDCVINEYIKRSHYRKQQSSYLDSGLFFFGSRLAWIFQPSFGFWLLVDLGKPWIIYLWRSDAIWSLHQTLSFILRAQVKGFDVCESK